MFTQSDLEQLSARGISLKQAEAQLDSFRTGFPALDIVSAATVGQGIMRVENKEQCDAFLKCWEEYLADASHTILKFVPASGAASRMFKDLFAFVDSGVETPFIQTFIKGLDNFAFAGELKKRAEGKGHRELVRILLEDMQYGKLPKEVEALFDKKRLELLCNLNLIDKVSNTKGKFTIVLSKDYSDHIDGIKLFEYVNTISRDMVISYKNNRLSISLDNQKENIAKMLKLVDNLDKLEKPS